MSVEMIKRKRDSVLKVLDLVHKELEDKKREIDETIRAKNEIEEVKRREIVRFRDNIIKVFNEEINILKILMLWVAGMEDKIETMESHVEVLMNEKDALQQSLLEAQRECDDSRAKVEFSGINSNHVLEMLKSTAAELVCRFEEGAEEVGSNEQKPEEEIQLYAEQLHVIKDVFRSKDKMVADMKQQSEVLHNSVAQAYKMKSFWTVISSATSILAAALAAYVAKGR